MHLSPFYRHTKQSLDAQLQKDMNLLSSLSRENLETVLSTECVVIPQDILKLCPNPNQDHR